MSYSLPAPAGPALAADSVTRLESGEPVLEIVDPRFRDCIDMTAQLERLHRGNAMGGGARVLR